MKCVEHGRLLEVLSHLDGQLGYGLKIAHSYTFCISAAVSFYTRHMSHGNSRH